jgi:hypothetical protein
MHGATHTMEGVGDEVDPRRLRGRPVDSNNKSKTLINTGWIFPNGCDVGETTMNLCFRWKWNCDQCHPV